ncbi:MAG: hypothetical protein JO287_13185 [Pseudonocardiales bacterium]|nr:hypothetical protein [Pseudonocardiales bacterium]
MKRLHRGQLDRAADRVLELLDAGGTVIAFSGGEPIPEFLPGVHWQTGQPTSGGGWSPTPTSVCASATRITRCCGGSPCATAPGTTTACSTPGGCASAREADLRQSPALVDRVSTPGTVVVSTSDPINHYGGYFMPATGQFLDAFLPWAAETSLELAARFSL